MLAAFSFLAGLAIAGYGVARWFWEREELLLGEIGQHYERRQRLMLERIEDGDRALRSAYADLDELEAYRAMATERLTDARTDLDVTLAGKAGLQQVLERRTAALATAEVRLERLRRANAKGGALHEGSPDERISSEPADVATVVRLKQTS